MRSKEVAVVALVCGILGAQLFAQVVGTAGSLWRFMPYHMYSDTYAIGATITLHEARVTSVGYDQPVRTLVSSDVGLSTYKFEGLLRAASAGQGWLLNAKSNGAATDLQAIVRDLGPYTSLQLWALEYTIGPEGLKSRTPTRALVREWSWAESGKP